MSLPCLLLIRRISPNELLTPVVLSFLLFLYLLVTFNVLDNWLKWANIHNVNVRSINQP